MVLTQIQFGGLSRLFQRRNKAGAIECSPYACLPRKRQRMMPEGRVLVFILREIVGWFQTVHIHETIKESHEQMEFQVCGTDKYGGRSERGERV